MKKFWTEGPKFPRQLVSFCVVSGIKCNKGVSRAFKTFDTVVKGQPLEKRQKSNYVRTGSVRCELCYLTKKVENTAIVGLYTKNNRLKIAPGRFIKIR